MSKSEQVYKAKAYWQDQGLDEFDFILLLPDADEALSGRMRAAFEAKLNGRSGIVVDGEEARLLAALYSLYAFTDKLIVGLFDEPFGRKLHCLLESGVATEEELVNGVILGVMDG